MGGGDSILLFCENDRPMQYIWNIIYFISVKYILCIYMLDIHHVTYHSIIDEVEVEVEVEACQSNESIIYIIRPVQGPPCDVTLLNHRYCTVTVIDKKKCG